MVAPKQCSELTSSTPSPGHRARVTLVDRVAARRIPATATPVGLVAEAMRQRVLRGIGVVLVAAARRPIGTRRHLVRDCRLGGFEAVTHGQVRVLELTPNPRLRHPRARASVARRSARFVATWIGTDERRCRAADMPRARESRAAISQVVAGGARTRTAVIADRITGRELTASDVIEGVARVVEFRASTRRLLGVALSTTMPNGCVRAGPPPVGRSRATAARRRAPP